MRNHIARWAVAVTFAVLLFPWSGCGSSTPDFGSAPDEVVQLVGSIPDNARSPQTFAAIFSSTAAPDETKRRQLIGYIFVAKSASVSGDTATVKVEIRRPVDNEPVGETEWTAVKEGGHWKLKDTPLPSGPQ